ncbi:CHAD domain-containing protein [Pseudomonas sp. R2.Fl]|nr:CHAD domain-containing protein [Pseudomonas sp. R2.Fl]
MPYRIRPGHPFTEEVRAVAREQLEAAMKALAEQPHGPHEAIHDARKKFKRVRALYRLVARGEREFRTGENVRLRDTARSLSTVRDATALVETLDFLAENAATESEEQAIVLARTTLEERRDRIATAETDLSAKIEATIGECREAIVAVEELTFDDAPAKTAKRLAKAWAKGLQRGRDALAGCHETADAEVFHELRKAGQAYWMNLSLLRNIWPSAMRAKRLEAKALVDALGHEHDISILIALLDDEPGLIEGGEKLAYLLGAIIREQQEIRRDALELADRVFADEPEVEGRIVRKLWLAAARA